MKNEYEVKSPLWIKIFTSIGYIALCVAMTFDSESSILNLWKSRDLIGVIGLLFFFFVLPLILLIILFTKTVFTNTEIIHTNFILMKMRRPYKDIDTVQITRRSDVRLHFVDGASIKILTGENYLAKTLQILEERVNIKLKQ